MKKDLVFVFIQFVLFALYFIDFNFFEFHVALPDLIKYLAIGIGSCGLLIILLGIVNLNENLSPFPSPRKNSSLISRGIYRYVRHPIYSGILICLAAYAIYDGSPERLLITALLGVVLYLKSNFEEHLLVKRFPKYSEYQKRTGRFFPKKNNNNKS